MPENQKPSNDIPEDIFESVEQAPLVGGERKASNIKPIVPAEKNYKTAPPPPNLMKVSKPITPPGPSSSSQVQDILSGVERSQHKIETPQSLRSSLQPAMPQGLEVKQPNAPPALENEKEARKPLLKAKNFIIIGILIVGIGGLAFAGYYVSTSLSQRESVPKTLPEADEIQPPAQDSSSEEQGALEQNIPAQTQNPPVALDQDSDFDGLSDNEERLYGTDVKLADSDSDLLTDRDEVKTFGTDPLNPDTDGDGYKDGEEVSNRYNPKGAGKLFETP